MTADDAYKAACERWGDDACVWSPSSNRFVVGRWVTIGHLSVREPAPSSTVSMGVTYPVVLTSRRGGMIALGTGASWEAAFAMADTGTTGTVP